MRAFNATITFEDNNGWPTSPFKDLFWRMRDIIQRNPDDPSGLFNVILEKCSIVEMWHNENCAMDANEPHKMTLTLIAADVMVDAKKALTLNRGRP
jgi:hypothetical protein